MNGREELPAKASQRVGNPQPGRVVRYGNHDVYRLDREHALEHLDIPQDRIPPHPVRKRGVRVIVEPEHAISQLAGKQNVQCDPPVTTSTYYGDSHLFVECQTLHLDFWFRHAGSGFRLSYRRFLPREIALDSPGILASSLACCSYTHIMRSLGATMPCVGVPAKEIHLLWSCPIGNRAPGGVCRRVPGAPAPRGSLSRNTQQSAHSRLLCVLMQRIRSHRPAVWSARS